MIGASALSAHRYTGLPQELHVSGTWDSIRRAVAENAHLADPMLDVYSTSANAVRRRDVVEGSC